MSFELADKRTLQMQYTGQTQGKDVVAVVKQEVGISNDDKRRLLK